MALIFTGGYHGDSAENDLQHDIDELRDLGALADDGPIYFTPPFEWYDADQVLWARRMNALLFNFTPSIQSHRDWAPEDHPAYWPSQDIYDAILQFEASDPNGLGGALMLMHLGTTREDKMHLHLGPLLDELIDRGYQFERVDSLLSLCAEP